MQRTPSPRILTLPAHSRLFLLVLKPKHRRFFDSLHPIVSNTAAEPTAPVCWNKVKREQGRIEREGNKSEKGVRIPHFAVNTTQRHRRVFSSRAGQETQGGERPTTPTAPGRWLQDIHSKLRRAVSLAGLNASISARVFTSYADDVDVRGDSE
eukprot:2700757-Rhodomonas_salina.1